MIETAAVFVLGSFIGVCIAFLILKNAKPRLPW